MIICNYTTTVVAKSKMRPEAMKAETSPLMTTSKIVINDRRLSQFEHPSVYPRRYFPQEFSTKAKTKKKILKPDVVVAKDGSGKYKTIHEAPINTVPMNGDAVFVIHVKEGVYKENVHINSTMTNVMIVGDGPKKTKITGNRNVAHGTPTGNTATVTVDGNGFTAKNIGFENSSGPGNYQAIALVVKSDKSIFYNCEIDGYQDTLYTQVGRQFFRDCTISGTIDFIFGDASVIFQNCLILVRKPLDKQENTVTAQGRTSIHSPTAIVLHTCTIRADPSYYPMRKKIPTYLGRPWRQYSRTIVMQSYIGDVIAPAGWLPWAGDFALDTLEYFEFDNRGPRANMTRRVRWKGVKSMSRDEANSFTVANFIQGDLWIKGVPYIPGLLPS